MKESPRPPRTFLDYIIEGNGLWHNRKKLFSKGRTRAVWVQPRGCKGRSPLHEITLVSPFPPGRGSGGWGQKSKLKGGLAGNQPGTPPAGHRDAPLTPPCKGHAPRRARGSPPSPVPRPAQPRGCKGRSPLHKITLVSPFPTGEGGRGDILPLRGRGAKSH